METATRAKELEIGILKIRKAALVFRAINHELRRRILTLVHENKRMRVTPIYVKLRQEQSVISTHLGILRKAGMVIAEKKGKNVFYSVNYKRVEEIGQIATRLLSS